jgi:hypothetical protein
MGTPSAPSRVDQQGGTIYVVVCLTHLCIARVLSEQEKCHFLGSVGDRLLHGDTAAGRDRQIASGLKLTGRGMTNWLRGGAAACSLPASTEGGACRGLARGARNNARDD